MAIVTALANATIPLCLLGSYVIYKEELTCPQVSGSLICMAGITVLALSVHPVTDETAAVSVSADD